MAKAQWPSGCLGALPERPRIQPRSGANRNGRSELDITQRLSRLEAARVPDAGREP